MVSRLRASNILFCIRFSVSGCIIIRSYDVAAGSLGLVGYGFSRVALCAVCGCACWCPFVFVYSYLIMMAYYSFIIPGADRSRACLSSDEAGVGLMTLLRFG